MDSGKDGNQSYSNSDHTKMPGETAGERTRQTDHRADGCLHDAAKKQSWYSIILRSFSAAAILQAEFSTFTADVHNIGVSPTGPFKKNDRS